LTILIQPSALAYASSSPKPQQPSTTGFGTIGAFFQKIIDSIKKGILKIKTFYAGDKTRSVAIIAIGLLLLIGFLYFRSRRRSSYDYKRGGPYSLVSYNKPKKKRAKPKSLWENAIM
jgi:LPXTG-motif cell wall-anchored protein